jgi:hypothetical protein
MTLKVQRVWDQLESQQMCVHGVLRNDHGCHSINLEKTWVIVNPPTYKKMKYLMAWPNSTNVSYKMLPLLWLQ